MTRPVRLRFTPVGVEVEGGLFWVDAKQPKRFGVITHAHGDHVARHETTLCTPETAAFLRRRSGAGARLLEARYGETVRVGDFALTLHSAGHVLGSAVVHARGPGQSVLFSGDWHLEGGLTRPPADPVPADVLVTEATFGRPDLVLPPAESVRAQIVAFARDALARRVTPVFLAYALGKGQEVMAILGGAGIPVAAHGSIFKLCSVYRAAGIVFPHSRKLQGKGKRVAAIVVPPRFLRSPEVQRAAPLAVAAVTGWGERARSPGVCTAFPLSDHGDFAGLCTLVDRVAPKTIFTLHGYAEEFAAALRGRGYDARAVPGHRGPEEGTVPGAFGAALENDPGRFAADPPNTP